MMFIRTNDATGTTAVHQNVGRDITKRVSDTSDDWVEVRAVSIGLFLTVGFSA